MRRSLIPMLTLAAVPAVVVWQSAAVPTPSVQAPRLEPVTFSEHIAPILYENCVTCHRPGEAAPFSLISYEDVSRRARLIADVTRSRYMPPWHAEPGFGDFLDERRLTDAQIERIGEWVRQGRPRGDATKMPTLPAFTDGWQLGKPDLVLEMPEAFEVPADGPDVYRNFVIPVPIPERRYVRALAFRPGNPKVVHHALIKVDQNGEGRRRDQQDSELGFPGMVIRSDAGHFLSWQPGRLPLPAPSGLSWEIHPGNDLVVQMHMSPSGKREDVQPSIGFYFTDEPPNATPFRILLTSITMDIPAGETNYAITDDYTLPVDVDALAILPHAHYLGKKIAAWATLPNGQTKPLIRIDDWDFNWQSDYQYKTPVSLPAGTKLSTKFTFDNSTNNIRNPHHPPQRVRYGLESTDEMAELWLQVLPKHKEDFNTLRADYARKAQTRFFEGNLTNARNNPSDAAANAIVGQIYFLQERFAEAEKHLRAAVAADPNHAPGRYGLGVLFRHMNKLPEAQTELEAAARLDPQDPRPHSNLGFIALVNDDLDRARTHFQAALKLNPADRLAQAGTEELARRLNDKKPRN